jgi:dTDP-4-dehydrorhamnose 3,5-epimerase
LPSAFLIQGRPWRDHRGTFQKTVHREFFEKHGLEWSFAEQFFTTSGKDVVRGMHFQAPPHDHVKLIYCTHGSATDVLLDLREGSSTYGKCAEVSLNAGDGKTIYIPKGIAHGFRSLEKDTTIQYCVSTSHQPEADKGIRWDSIPYDWKIAEPVLSERDRALPAFAEFKTPFKGKL